MLIAAAPLSAEPIDFRRALELALKHSGAIMSATADRARAAERYRAERYSYVPTIIFGSSAGYSVGNPVAIAGQAPSIYNVTHNQSVFNLALQQQLKALHSDSVAADIEYVDSTEQVILDTALLYIELDSAQQRLELARSQKQSVDHALFIAQQRLQEGVSELIDTKRAELDSARVDLRIADLESSVDVLRERLARSIGVPPSSLEILSGSIPAAPSIRDEDDLASAALSNSASVRVADEHLRAAKARARAEHRVNYPSFDFTGQYAEFAPYLNYGTTNHTNHNYSFGINLKIPILNLAQNARAAAADAEALHAEGEAQKVRDQVADDAVRAQHQVRQLQAQLKVSRLEYEVAQANIDAVKVQIQNGHATARDQEMANADVAGRQLLLLQSQFDFLRAQLQLLRQTGELRSWALGTK
jgi:outer membrane protein TolC